MGEPLHVGCGSWLCENFSGRATKYFRGIASLRVKSCSTLHFEPIGRAPGTVSGVLALRDDAFEAKLAGMGEDGRAVAFHVFVEPDAGAGLGHDRRERGLADLKRIAPQVIAVLLDEIEGVQERAIIMAAVANEIERGNAVVIADDCLAVDDARARAQARQRLNDQREAVGEVVARTAIEPHPLAGR